jgi:hypothetical protein
VPRISVGFVAGRRAAHLRWVCCRSSVCGSGRRAALLRWVCRRSSVLGSGRRRAARLRCFSSVVGVRHRPSCRASSLGLTPGVEPRISAGFVAGRPAVVPGSGSGPYPAGLPACRQARVS